LEKLICYFAAPPAIRWTDRLGCDEYEKYGFDVQIWDLSSIFYRNDRIEGYSIGSPYSKYKGSNIVKIRSVVELEQAVREIDSETLLWIINRGPLARKFNAGFDLQMFNRYNVKYMVSYLVPRHKPIGLIGKMKYGFFILKARIKARTSNWENKPTLVISTGRLGREQIQTILPFRKYIFKNMPSANIVWSKQPREIFGKYIVYVEESVGHSPDASLLNIPNYCHDIEGFYHRINRVFEQIENWTGFEIVIAASGKYQYKNNQFGARKIIYRKTQELIQHSEIVLGHRSMGLQQAIVDRKPILQLCDQGFSKLKNSEIRAAALLYGKEPLWTV